MGNGLRTIARQPMVGPQANESSVENEARWRAQVAGQITDLTQRLEALELQLQAVVTRLDDGGIP